MSIKKKSLPICFACFLFSFRSIPGAERFVWLFLPYVFKAFTSNSGVVAQMSRVDTIVHPHDCFSSLELMPNQSSGTAGVLLSH